MPAGGLGDGRQSTRQADMVINLHNNNNNINNNTNTARIASKERARMARERARTAREERRRIAKERARIAREERARARRSRSSKHPCWGIPRCIRDRFCCCGCAILVLLVAVLILVIVAGWSIVPTCNFPPRAKINATTAEQGLAAGIAPLVPETSIPAVPTIATTKSITHPATAMAALHEHHHPTILLKDEDGDEAIVTKGKEKEKGKKKDVEVRYVTKTVNVWDFECEEDGIDG